MVPLLDMLNLGKWRMANMQEDFNGHVDKCNKFPYVWGVAVHDKIILNRPNNRHCILIFDFLIFGLPMVFIFEYI